MNNANFQAMPDKNTDHTLLPPHVTVSLPTGSSNPTGALFAQQLGPGLTIPFQEKFWKYEGNAGFNSRNIADFQTVQHITQLGRLCTLTSLELICFPIAEAASTAFTFECIWTPADLIPTAGNLMTFTGASRFSVGGPQNFGNVSVIANLKDVNPTIRSSVAFVDTPRISVSTLAAAKSVYLCDFYVRGAIHVAFPSIR